ncbi:MAG: thiamine phosphate synthase [Bacteroidetes bacterium]|nr:thiamine phosphate synthase [Bacteroidota bacterium]
MLKKTLPSIQRLHYITHDVEGKTHAQLAQEACAAGVRWVQLRVKNKTEAEWRAIALETQAVCKQHEAVFIINDNIDLAIEIQADGVHLGKQDMPTAQARKKAGASFIIGGTANTFEDIQVHTQAGVNYIGLGPYRYTATKKQLSPILGVEGYKSIIQQCTAHKIQIPILAIGGLLPEDVPELKKIGVYGVAVAAALTQSLNKKECVQKFLTHIP